MSLIGCMIFQLNLVLVLVHRASCSSPKSQAAAHGYSLFAMAVC